MAEVQDESKIEEQQQQQQTTVTGEVIETEIVKLTVVNQTRSFEENHNHFLRRRKVKCLLKI